MLTSKNWRQPAKRYKNAGKNNQKSSFNSLKVEKGDIVVKVNEAFKKVQNSAT